MRNGVSTYFEVGYGSVLQFLLITLFPFIDGFTYAGPCTFTYGRTWQTNKKKKEIAKCVCVPGEELVEKPAGRRHGMRGWLDTEPGCRRWRRRRKAAEEDAHRCVCLRARLCVSCIKAFTKLFRVVYWIHLYPGSLSLISPSAASRRWPRFSCFSELPINGMCKCQKTSVSRHLTPPGLFSHRPIKPLYIGTGNLFFLASIRGGPHHVQPQNQYPCLIISKKPSIDET